MTAWKINQIERFQALGLMGCLLVSIIFALQSAMASDPYREVRRCTPKTERKNSDDLLRDLSWLNFDPSFGAPDEKIELVKRKHASADAVYAGQNTYLVNCSRFDVQRIAGEIEASFRRGLACLVQHGPRWRKDAGRLLALLDSGATEPLVIRCQQDGPESLGMDRSTGVESFQMLGQGEAFVCTNTLYPGFIVSKSEARRLSGSLGAGINRALSQSRLFHEFSHLLGYLHYDPNPRKFDQHDIVRSIQSCCFPEAYDQNNPEHLGDVFNQPGACDRLDHFSG